MPANLGRLLDHRYRQVWRKLLQAYGCGKAGGASANDDDVGIDMVAIGHKHFRGRAPHVQGRAQA
ncbi:hypothetical protein D3C83_125820 [compost metagenome]